MSISQTPHSRPVKAEGKLFLVLQAAFSDRNCRPELTYRVCLGFNCPGIVSMFGLNKPLSDDSF
jgi:hypothetical protein